MAYLHVTRPGATDLPPLVDQGPAGGELDDDALVLSPDQAQQIDQFRQKFRVCENDAEKYQLCTEARDKVLEQHTGLQFLSAGYEHVMFVECAEYKTWKERRHKVRSRSAEPNKDEAAQWDEFVDVVKNASEIKSRCLNPLKAVAKFWGRDFVQHYQLASRGPKYCEVAAAAARVVRDRDEAVTKLNRLRLRRFRAPGRRHLRHDINSIDQIDFVNLKAWPDKNPFDKDKDATISLPCEKLDAGDLPDGFGFDKFGGMVHKEYAVALPETNRTNTAEPPVLPETDGAGTAEPSALPGADIADTGPATAEPSALPGADIADTGPATAEPQQPISKRPRLDEPHPFPDTHMPRPMHDRVADDTYRKQVLDELQENPGQAMPLRGSHGEENRKLIRRLLENIKPPNTDGSQANEAWFCTGDEAQSRVDSSLDNTPIITEGQQQFRWKKGDRPIVQLFRRMGGFDRSVSVQIPSLTADSFQVRKLSEVQKRFLDKKDTDDPWNILDLQSPLPASILPSFLTGENCQLLLQIRDTVLMGNSAERVVAPREQWNEWKNILEWVLLSEAGHNTAPHTDSHGLSTWITAQEECVGFGWMSHPTQQEEEKWMADPQHYTGGRWRYVILKPGQTVFFISGTIHFVFRLRSKHTVPQTLSLGGHILQWSGIERWLQVVIAQMKIPAITNEDMESSAPKYVSMVADLVRTKVKNGRVEELGGKAAVMRFFASMKVSLPAILGDTRLTIPGI
ncbi:hypothetical protein B0T24DRAFT_540016 [Lasiosphaeria ovina]|uniref:JmjC domain-containing protein n=1 Tax=Lasiosphaeria ovina TaxID=92902 RepID=A0AAE0MYA6_9PEZI|nr:hypothetical protein B0T24DRAFT_540016 [Lasiosphaeria ovina]